MKHFMSYHTITTRTSYRNTTQVTTTQCTILSATPTLGHQPQYTPFSTTTVYQLPKPQYRTHCSTYKTAYTD